MGPSQGLCSAPTSWPADVAHDVENRQESEKLTAIHEARHAVEFTPLFRILNPGVVLIVADDDQFGIGPFEEVAARAHCDQPAVETADITPAPVKREIFAILTIVGHRDRLERFFGVHQDGINGIFVPDQAVGGVCNPVAELLSAPVPSGHLVAFRRVSRFVNDDGRAVFVEYQDIVLPRAVKLVQSQFRFLPVDAVLGSRVGGSYPPAVRAGPARGAAARDPAA